MNQNNSFNTITELLKLVQHNKFPVDLLENEFSQNSPAIFFCSELEKNIVEVAIEHKYILGLSSDYYQNYMPLIVVNSPTLTPLGESYLQNQTIWKKHPILEKLIIILLTGIISAITTLVVNRLTN